MVKRIINSVKSILFADPNLLLEEEKNLVNQPFYFPGTNGKGVLLIHGWTSTPYEVRRLGKYLNESGYTVYGPRLKGHGTFPKELKDVEWQEWLKDVEDAYLRLKNGHRKVYIGGTSMGANLAAVFASKRKDINGLILMAAPFKIRWEKFMVALAKFLKKIKNYHRKFYPPTFGVSTTITRLISYQTYPITSALEIFDLVKNSRECLKDINQPCLLMQSTHDHVVSRNSLENIYENIPAERKEKKYVRQAYHTFISDIKNEHVFEDILNFLNEN